MLHLNLTLFVYYRSKYVNVSGCISKKMSNNDHPWDPIIVVIVDRWSLFRGHLKVQYSTSKWWPVVTLRRWSLAQV